jgi:hypothetical protein
MVKQRTEQEVVGGVWFGSAVGVGVAFWVGGGLGVRGGLSVSEGINIEAQIQWPCCNISSSEISRLSWHINMLQHFFLFALRRSQQCEIQADYATRVVWVNESP